jgi:peptide deformylase
VARRGAAAAGPQGTILIAPVIELCSVHVSPHTEKSRLPRTALAMVALAACAACSADAKRAPEAEPPMTSARTALPAIVQTGADVLRARATEVSRERIGTPEMQQLFATMISTMRAAPGVGLAAPQIGVPLRVIVLEDRDELLAKLTPLERAERERVPFPARVIVNPVVVPVGTDRAVFFEGCLSVAGFVGLVDRAAEVEVTGLDDHAAPVAWRVRGWPARILQHEVDHVDGTLYVDRMMPRSFSTQDQARARYAGKPIAEIRRLLGL